MKKPIPLSSLIATALLLQGCASNYVAGWAGERRWFNHSIPFYMQQKAFNVEHQNCKASVWGGRSIPTVTFSTDHIRTFQGSAIIRENGRSETVYYEGTVTETPSFSKGFEVGYGIGSAIAEIEAANKAEVDCIKKLGWKDVGKDYTPFYMNENIPFNKAIMDLIRSNYSRPLFDNNNHTLLVNKSLSKSSTRKTPAKIEYVMLKNNEYAFMPIRCEIFVKKDMSFLLQCDDGSSSNGPRLAKDSALGIYLSEL